VILPTDESASPHQCIVASGGGNSWRCPCCGVSSPTATAAQKHLEEAHAGVLRAFRCTICKYRGNTLRGMRTHIRMHFSAADKAGDMREEDYISCVLVGEPEPRPIEEPEPESPERDEESRKAIGCIDRNHSCDQCSYSSNYKGNLLRHMKSVHHRNIESEDGGSPTPPPVNSHVSTPSPETLVIKLEPSEEKISLTEDPPPPSSVSSSPASPADVSVTTASRYCKSCDISFSYLSTFIAHKRFYCSGQPSGTPAPALSPPVSPAASPAATPRPEASAHT
jgi:zinc finger protein ZFPM1